MRDPIDDAFARLEADVVAQAQGPGLDRIAGAARRRQRTRFAGVAAAAVMIAGSAGILIDNEDSSAVGPAGPGPTSESPSNTPAPTPESPIDALQSGDPPIGVWMQEGDLPAPEDGEWSYGDPGEYQADAVPNDCLNDVVEALIEREAISGIWVQEAVANPELRVQHYVFAVAEDLRIDVRSAIPADYRGCIADSGRELFEYDQLNANVQLYPDPEASESYVLAVSADGGLAALTFYIGLEDTMPVLNNDVDASQDAERALAAIADLVRTNAGIERPRYLEEDPYLPTDLPDDVWLRQDDLRRVVDEQWFAYGPSNGVSEDTPECVSQALADVDGLQHQGASTESGESIIHYAYLSPDSGYDVLRVITEQCARGDMITGWDGTVVSSAVFFVFDEQQPYPEWYWLAFGESRNGTTLTVYQGSQVDQGYPDSDGNPGFPTAEEFADADLTLALGDLAGHIAVVNRAYIEACIAAGGGCIDDE